MYDITAPLQNILGKGLVKKVGMYLFCPVVLNLRSFLFDYRGAYCRNAVQKNSRGVKGDKHGKFLTWFIFCKFTISSFFPSCSIIFFVICPLFFFSIIHRIKSLILVPMLSIIARISSHCNFDFDFDFDFANFACHFDLFDGQIIHQFHLEHQNFFRYSNFVVDFYSHSYRFLFCLKSYLFFQLQLLFSVIVFVVFYFFYFSALIVSKHYHFQLLM